MKRARIIHIAAGLAAVSLASIAFAQYVWVDEKGVKQYSDRSPPASVPNSRILKQPGSVPAPSNPQAAPAASPSENSAAATASEASARSKTPMTITEKNADFQKRKTEQVEKEKKAAEEANWKAENAKNCERTRAYQRSLESGERIAHTDKNGERSFLTDEQRAREMNETKRILQACK